MIRRTEEFIIKLSPFESRFNDLEDKYGKWETCKILINEGKLEQKKEELEFLINTYGNKHGDTDIMERVEQLQKELEVQAKSSTSEEIGGIK